VEETELLVLILGPGAVGLEVAKLLAGDAS